jgi:hypothetical protein
MKKHTLDVPRSIAESLADRRAFLGKASALTLGAVLAALSAPEAAGAFASVPPPTSYTTLLGLCSGGSITNTYTPGITNTLQPIHIDATTTYPPCSVAQNKVVIGNIESLNTIMSCSSVTDRSGGGTISYSNGQMSTWTMDSWTATPALGQKVGVSSGLISNGPFNGARVWFFGSRLTRDPSQCASANGVTTATGTSTLIIAQ